MCIRDRYNVGRTKLNAAKRISEELGRKVVFDGTMTVDKTGAIDPETGTIRLNARVGGPENLFDNALRLLEEQEAEFPLDSADAGGYNSKEERLLLEAAGVGGAKTLTYKTTSGIKLTSVPQKTTTVLGRYDSDTKNIIKELGVPKSTDFSGNKGGFNPVSYTHLIWYGSKRESGELLQRDPLGDGLEERHTAKYRQRQRKKCVLYLR